MSLTARRVQLVRRPVGLPVADDVEIVDVALPDVTPGTLLVENLLYSVDPYHREALDAGHWPLHGPWEGRTVGRVLESGVPGVAEGDLVFHRSAYATHAVVTDHRPITPPPGVPLSAYLGILGGTGLTAWVGLVRIARLQAGESLLVTAAAGAVGTAAGHLARALKAELIVGSTGSAAKAERLRQGPFDEAIDYRSTPLLEAVEGRDFDVVLEGVGGEQLAAAIAGAKDPGGRIAWVGAVAQYNDRENPPAAPANLYDVVLKQLRVEGYLVKDHLDAREEFEAFVVPLVQDGTIPVEQTVTEGLESSLDALRSVLTGGNYGKQIVRLDGGAS